MIIGPLAPAVKRFSHDFLADAPGRGVWAGIALPILLHGLLLAARRHPLQVLGEATLVHWLCAGSVCRWLARLRFPVDQWPEHAFRRLLEAALRYDPDGDLLLIFDGTDTLPEQENVVAGAAGAALLGLLVELALFLSVAVGSACGGQLGGQSVGAPAQARRGARGRHGGVKLGREGQEQPAMVLLGCSGPGAAQAIARSIAIGYEQAAVGGGLLALSLCLWACLARRWVYPGLCAGLLLLHPAWTVSAIHGECGSLKRELSWVFTGIGCVVVLLQVCAVVLGRAQRQRRQSLTAP